MLTPLEELLTLVNALLNGGALYLLGRTIRELRKLVFLADEARRIVQEDRG